MQNLLTGCCSVFLFLILLPPLQGQDIRAVPDTLNHVRPGNRIYVEAPLDDSLAWHVDFTHRAWLVLERDEIILSGDVQKGESVQRLIFRAMKPGLTQVRLLKKTHRFSDTLIYQIQIAAWAAPFKQLSELKEGASTLKAGSGSQIRAGTSVVIEQSENRNTPYFWRVDISDETIASLDRQQYFPNEDDPTAAGIHAWRIRAINPGRATVTLRFVGPGKKGARPAIETLLYELEVLP